MPPTAAQLQQQFIQLRENKIFETFVILVIVISALMIGAKTYPIPASAAQVLRLLDIGITIFFLVEIIIRMIAEQSLKRFFSKAWNVFDFLIVTASLIPVDDSEAALLGRLLRVFRVLRLVSIIPELRVLLNAFVTAIPRMGYVSLLMFIIFYIYAAIGSMFFHQINPELWGNITIAMLTLFRIATFEDWTDVMYETMDVFPLSWFFYLSFIFIVAFVFLNMMIGIVLETLQREHEEFSRESGEGEAGEVHRIDTRTAEMEQRLIKMESMLEQLTRDRAATDKP
ncbi:MAG: ion transporter [Candidatus Thiodiazotropha taylori]|uniref:Ion transporter n=1 Tax=Candidatus Thiodiazotropha taylori TaxID=2792791 RepID=A0A9E4KDJ3_9GAMM|nr:ion transporter [Candidatus Thiodiazotropha taylori]MCG7963694.1 ion transporter [Candidatus Thiodiazotropha endolucinida]MCG7967967.1 ion transporter [Candidatus Thiodiazotropha taylori]MCG8040601.1 ion transporter [Candidatus Thiodiazotropha taylori]MCG8054437.1 ion transporter [Candidatus Thiodiazotropha taylori]